MMFGDAVDFRREIFNLSRENMRHKGWIWWFWLFFIDNPANPAKPGQLMILWSKKNAKKIGCNDVLLDFTGNRKDEGVVACWYFDGEKMHHNRILEQCPLDIQPDRISSDSATPTSFSVESDCCRVKIGDVFDFKVVGGSNHLFNQPTYHKDDILADFSYSILRHNRLELTGKVDGEKIGGTAYFQRVCVNAPMPPWFWGIFHFKDSATLTYFKPHFMGFELRGDICFFDGAEMHIFTDVGVTRVEGECPSFRVVGKNRQASISFTVSSYSHSSWTFTGRLLDILKTTLVYNEYPAKIRDLALTGNDGKTMISSEELGEGVGNAEHATGVLL